MSPVETGDLLTVRLVHDWGGPVVVKPCMVVDESEAESPTTVKTVYIVWGVAQFKLSVYTGRLVGSAKRRVWRLHRDDLRNVRKLAGWRPRSERCKLPA